MNTILQTIIDHKKTEVERKKFYFPVTKFVRDLPKSRRSFKKTLQMPGLQIIAEMKKASPTEGLIRPDFDHLKIAKIYQKYASAISILTDEKFFSGKLQYLEDVDKISEIPLLQKDFIIDEYQIYEARKAGADAILLITSVLTEAQIDRFISLAKTYAMDCLVEVHNLEELEKVLLTKAEIIGINNRNLNTFDVSVQTTLNLVPSIPAGKVIVSESGFNTRKDIELIKDKVNAILIGTALMKSKNIEDRLKKWREVCKEPMKTDNRDQQLSMI